MNRRTHEHDYIIILPFIREIIINVNNKIMLTSIRSPPANELLVSDPHSTDCMDLNLEALRRAFYSYLICIACTSKWTLIAPKYQRKL
jgi:hypothetical protein